MGDLLVGQLAVAEHANRLAAVGGRSSDFPLHPARSIDTIDGWPSTLTPTGVAGLTVRLVFRQNCPRAGRNLGSDQLRAFGDS